MYYLEIILILFNLFYLRAKQIVFAMAFWGEAGGYMAFMKKFAVSGLIGFIR